jgi:dTDP-4-amino-4,6-dideoxygalactose transaminase
MPHDSPASAAPIPFVDLVSQRRRLGRRIDEAIARVARHGRLILGPEVEGFEAELAAFCGAAHAVTCASGTDALTLILRARGVGAGDAVIVPAFTFAATAEAVAVVGATPVFADVLEESFCLDPASVAAAARAARAAGLRPAGAIAVDLYGQPADYPALGQVAAAERLWLVADAAQSFGAEQHGRGVGTLAAATATSFYPSKPLGAYGDGGAILTDDPALAARLASLRNHGAGSEPYDHVEIGATSRLDAIQAAVLREKLAIFPEEIVARAAAAERYAEGLAGLVATPRLAPGNSSVWAQYTVRLGDRDALRARLAAAGIPTAVHYPKPLHHQPAFRGFPTASAALPVAERLAREVVSLPMHGYLSHAVQASIVQAVAEAFDPARAAPVE